MEKPEKRRRSLERPVVVSVSAEFARAVRRFERGQTGDLPGAWNFRTSSGNESFSGSLMRTALRARLKEIQRVD